MRRTGRKSAGHRREGRRARSARRDGTCRGGPAPRDQFTFARAKERTRETGIAYAKALRAALGGAVAIVIATVVSNILFFQAGRSILFETERQSPKVIAVLFEMEPLPLMFTNGPLYLAIAAGLGAIHGLVFFWIEPALPRGIVRRGASFGVILWALMALYFEFHAPFNMFGEPPGLVAVELAFWVVVTLVQGLALSALYGKGRHELASPVE